MELTPYVDSVRQELAVAAQAGGQDARDLAERLTAPLASSIRLALLDALSAAATEITRDLAPGSVDLRLRGREPSFVVTAPPTDGPPQPQDSPFASAPPRVPAPAEGDDGAMARINLRLAEDLKGRVEDAARLAGISVNAWLVRAASAALDPDTRDRPVERRASTGGASFTGWVR